MRLEWSPLAVEDRRRIFDFIEKDDPRAAILVDDRIAAQMLVLLRFPEGGRPGRIAGTRELVVRRTPYIAAYLVAKDCVRILRILHSAQLWPEEMSAPR